MKKKVVIIGPAHPLRGGLAAFDHRLAKQFIDEGFDCSIFTYSLQYPSILFPGKTQYSSDPAPEGIPIFVKINSINPLNWIAVGNSLKRLQPDLVIVRYWLPFLGPALGTILRRIKRNEHTAIIAITDNIAPHEKRPGDSLFTKYFVRSCDAFVTMSEKVMRDLRRFEQHKPAVQVLHPLYDNFGERLSKETARAKLGIGADEKLVLFFGFIRRYKGLDLLLQAMADKRIRQQGIRLLVAGEFYEDEKPYHDLIKENRIEDLVLLRTEFIPDSDVKYYLSAADVIVQPYRNATQSGVTPLAYHFETPMIVTNIGGLPEAVPHEKSGLVAEPEPNSIANAIVRFFELGREYFIPHLRTEKQKYSWHKLVATLLELQKEIKK